MFQPSPSLSSPVQPRIQVSGDYIKTVESFKYLGHRISTKATLDSEIQNRISSAAAAFGRLNKRVFANHNLRKKTKLRVYNAVVVPTLLYGVET